MSLLANIVVALLALLHVYILILEMFLWGSPTSLRAFGLTPELASQTTALAANQGLYNGFLAAGLIWGLVLGEKGRSVKIFFLLCILVAGVFGAVTVNPKILLIQAIPAVIGLILIYLSPRTS
ncbi:MAG: DUF1304 domain-containing protein [Gammaproteobacteria bacterium]|nr:DUF1304 domain-containing protein [Gammaproteobacteria bacterium]